MLSISLYGFQMWYYNKVPLLYLLKELRNIQRRAVLWILGAFCTSPSAGIKAITGLLPIYLYLQKLNGRFHARAHTLPTNHIIKLLLKTRHMNDKEAHWLLLERLTPRQWVNIKDLIINIDNRFNEIFPSFSPLNCEFSPGNRLIDIFPNHFLFYPINRKSEDSVKTHLYKLNDITFYLSTDPHLIIVVSDASIKNNVTTLISHVHVYDSPVIKTNHHAVNIIFTEAELFLIRYGIN